MAWMLRASTCLVPALQKLVSETWEVPNLAKCLAPLAGRATQRCATFAKSTDVMALGLGIMTRQFLGSGSAGEPEAGVKFSVTAPSHVRRIRLGARRVPRHCVDSCRTLTYQDGRCFTPFSDATRRNRQRIGERTQRSAPKGLQASLKVQSQELENGPDGRLTLSQTLRCNWYSDTAVCRNIEMGDLWSGEFPVRLTVLALPSLEWEGRDSCRLCV